MKKGQLAPGTIVSIILAVVVLVAVLLFFTGRFQGAGQQFSDLSPQDIEVAVTSCRFACDTANAAVNVPEDCTNWQQQYCERKVVIQGQEVLCNTGKPVDAAFTDKSLFSFDCQGPFDACDCSGFTSGSSGGAQGGGG